MSAAAPRNERRVAFRQTFSAWGISVSSHTVFVDARAATGASRDARCRRSTSWHPTSSWFRCDAVLWCGAEATPALSDEISSRPAAR